MERRGTLECRRWRPDMPVMAALGGSWRGLAQARICLALEASCGGVAEVKRARPRQGLRLRGRGISRTCSSSSQPQCGQTGTKGW